MAVQQVVPALIRSRAEAQQRWFYGGGVHTWLATAEETGGAFFLYEAVMEQGKRTPLHTHPSEESLYLTAGQLLLHMDGDEHVVDAGSLVVCPRGVPHAFLVTSPSATLLCLQTPGSCQAFYLGASEPLTATTERVVDFGLIAKSAELNGGIDIVGPPPFPAA